MKPSRTRPTSAMTEWQDNIEARRTELARSREALTATLSGFIIDVRERLVQLQRGANREFMHTYNSLDGSLNEFETLEQALSAHFAELVAKLTQLEWKGGGIAADVWREEQERARLQRG